MVAQLQLSEKTRQLILERAERAGLSAEAFLTRLVQEHEPQPMEAEDEAARTSAGDLRAGIEKVRGSVTPEEAAEWRRLVDDGRSEV